MEFGLLSLLTWLPIAGGLVVLYVGDRPANRAHAVGPTGEVADLEAEFEL